MKDSKSSKIIYDYITGGKTPSGEEIPNIPVIWLRIKSPRKSAISPTLVDTGFDGGIYSDDRLPAVFEGESPIGTIDLQQMAGVVKCEIFYSKVEVVEEGGAGDPIDLGSVPVYVPIRVRELAENIIVGRMVLNQLDLYLEDGNRVEAGER